MLIIAPSLLNSFKNRACPQCVATDTERWLKRRKALALDCPNFHIVFAINPWDDANNPQLSVRTISDKNKTLLQR
jgi:hypothetical protein